ncbi:MAG: alkane 1-monooxygenase [Bacteroidota bacterium]
MWKDLKYLLAYLLPTVTVIGMYLGGSWAFAGVLFAFGLLPLLELVLPTHTENIEETAELSRSRRRFFDLLLYLNLPILYGIVGYYLYLVSFSSWTVGELVGLTLSVGTMIGTLGINVGHELGHRTTRLEQLMAQALLLPGLYLHFTIEHNRGHHKNVATPADPATSRRGEMVYAFWLRSSIGGWLGAWKLEAERLKKQGKPPFTFANQMLRFQLVQLIYLGTLAIALSPYTALMAILAGTVGFLLLETVNYIEHYGLMRKKTASGRYEPVQPIHSWNSDHELGRIFLYELTRHSDHHFKATRKYQILRRFEESPQLPVGYPASMLLSMVPPLWFAYMNPKLERLEEQERLVA